MLHLSCYYPLSTTSIPRKISPKLRCVSKLDETGELKQRMHQMSCMHTVFNQEIEKLTYGIWCLLNGLKDTGIRAHEMDDTC